MGIARRIAGAGAYRAQNSAYQRRRELVIASLWVSLLSLVMVAILLASGFPADWRLVGLVGLCCSFWLNRFVTYLCRDGTYIGTMLCQHVTFAILLTSHSYGGLTSPFLLWLALVPVLCGHVVKTLSRWWLPLVAIFTLEVGFFALLSTMIIPPNPIELSQLQALKSFTPVLFSATIVIIAVLLARAMPLLNEMAQADEQHVREATALNRKLADLQQSRTAQIASLARLKTGCHASAIDVTRNCAEVLEAVPADSPTSNRGDLLSIEVAATHLVSHIDDIGRYLER